MANEFRNAFSGFGRDILTGIRERANQVISDAEFDERVIGIEKATMAMLEADVAEDKIVEMLQKYWDLRLSEANSFVDEFVSRRIK